MNHGSCIIISTAFFVSFKRSSGSDPLFLFSSDGPIDRPPHMGNKKNENRKVKEKMEQTTQTKEEAFFSSNTRCFLPYFSPLLTWLDMKFKLSTTKLHFCSPRLGRSPPLFLLSIFPASAGACIRNPHDVSSPNHRRVFFIVFVLSFLESMGKALSLLIAAVDNPQKGGGRIRDIIIFVAHPRSPFAPSGG